MPNFNISLASLVASQNIKEISKLQGMNDSSSARTLGLIKGFDELRTTELGELWNQKFLSALEKLRRIFLEATLRRDRRISEIELRQPDSEEMTLLKDIYYLVGAAEKEDQDIIGRIERCLNRFTVFDNEIIKRAALDALGEIKKV